ncbi:MAG: serine protease Do [Verrucomicrobiales bacterium]|jgi:serine protease Do
MRAKSDADQMHSPGKASRTRPGRIALFSIGVLSLFAIGYFSALAVHWHSEARRIRDRVPVVIFPADGTQRAIVREPLASSPRDVDDLLDIQSRVVSCIEKCSPATVSVAIVGDHFRTGLAGSGVVVTEDGYVLTAGHVTAEVGLHVTITFPDGTSVAGETLGMSMASDTGMIKITDEGVYPFVPLAKAGDIEIGQWCLALGFPGGYDQQRGAVARIGRLIGTSLSTVRTDCKLLGGDSGGPLFNLAGELIGIHSKISDSPDENYHAPISAFHRGWQDLQDKEVILFWDERRGGYLGDLDCAPLEDDAGLLIRDLNDASPAAVAGLALGDVITHIDGHKIIDTLEYDAAIESRAPGSRVALRFRRGLRSSVIDVVLGEKPSPDSVR